VLYIIKFLKAVLAEAIQYCSVQNAVVSSDV